MKRIDADQIRTIHRSILEYSGENVVGERSDVSIVVDSTFETIFGEDRFPTLSAKAASYLHRLASGHFFHQGNKRTALEVTLAFLSVNGVDVSVPFAEGALWKLVAEIADPSTRPSFEEVIAFFVARIGP